MDNATLHIRKFNDRIRILNTSASKNVVLTAQEAKSLNADIQDLLAYCVLLNRKIEQLSQANSQEILNISVDGGKF